MLKLMLRLVNYFKDFILFIGIFSGVCGKLLLHGNISDDEIEAIYKKYFSQDKKDD